jgi:hypothetical protein
LRDSWKCVRSGRDLQCDEDSQIRDDSETICLERLLK